MEKRIIGLLFWLAPLFGVAQVNLSVQLPPGGLVKKEQLWNLVITNNTGGDIDATVLLNLQDAATGQSVLSASTGNFSLSRGMRVVTDRTVEPVQYTYSGTAMSANFLPLGSYTACYTVYKRRADFLEKVADECVRLNVSPLSPPMLVTPADGSVLTTAYPQLTWVAPAPLDLFSELNYEIKVVEVLPEQSSSQALLYNLPVFVKTNTKTTVENYPPSSCKLEAGKTYAWQVTARNGEAYAAPTEIWTFRVASDSAVAQQKRGEGYVQLTKDRSEAALSYVTDSLFVRYYSVDKPREASVRFLAADGKVIDERKQRLVYGENFLRFPIGKRYEPGKIYTLEISDERQNTYLLHFTCKPAAN